MKNKTNRGTTAPETDVDLSLLKDLERQSVEEIQKLRAHERIDRKIRLILQHGNSSRISEMRVPAYTSDVSAGGCCVISSAPIGVGDIFRISFDRDQLDVPMVFARCVRCRLLREDSFEVAFSFFSPISLGQSKQANKNDLLG